MLLTSCAQIPSTSPPITPTLLQTLGTETTHIPSPTSTLRAENHAPITPTFDPISQATPKPDEITPSATVTPGNIRLLKTFDLKGSFFSVSADEEFLALSDFPNSASVYNLSNGELVSEMAIPLASFGSIGKVAFYANDTLLATEFITDVVREARTRGAIYIWDWSAQKVNNIFQVSSDFHSPCYSDDFEISADERFLTILGCDYIEIWDLVTGMPVGAIDRTNVIDIAISKSENLLASARIALGEAPIQIWDLNSCISKCELKFELFNASENPDQWQEAKSVIFSNDGKWVFALINDALRIWDISKEEELLWLNFLPNNHLPVQIAFSPLDIVAILFDDGSIIFYEPDSGKEIGEIHIPGAQKIEFLPKGSRIIIGGGEINLQIWQVARKSQ